MSRDIPIIFSKPMVLALLAGRKTMTRRLLYSLRQSGGAVPNKATALRGHLPPNDPEFGSYYTLSPWYKVKKGDRLWVRENLTCTGDGLWRWAADNSHIVLAEAGDYRRAAMVAWEQRQERGSIPSIHMPRWASRITIEVEATKIERLQDISEEDAKAEGVDPAVAGWGAGDPPLPLRSYRTGFVRLWQSLHDEESWLDNPEVVAIAASAVIQQNIDTLKVAA